MLSLFSLCASLFMFSNVKMMSLPNPPHVSMPANLAHNNDDLFEGDIILSEKQKAALLRYRNESSETGTYTLSHTVEYWEDGVAPYVFSHDDEDWQATIEDVLNLIMSETCIKFVKREPHMTNYIDFVHGDDCSSYVGRNDSDATRVSLGKNCLRPSVIAHEIFHALGRWHEHSRVDRDDYVEIMRDNIDEHMAYNFDKHNTDTNGTKYDFASIMHYGPYYFAKAKDKVTIKTKDSNYQHTIGQRYEVAPADFIKVNQRYCSNACPNHVCVNGYPSPSQSCACTCYKGFSGPKCDKLLPEIDERCQLHHESNHTVSFKAKLGTDRPYGCIFQIPSDGRPMCAFVTYKLECRSPCGEKEFFEVRKADDMAYGGAKLCCEGKSKIMGSSKGFYVEFRIYGYKSEVYAEFKTAGCDDELNSIFNSLDKKNSSGNITVS